MLALRRVTFSLAVAAIAASAALVSVAPAAAKAPCYRAVINDWYDNGRIDHVYPLACYREALKNLPLDVQEYADAHDVISRALATAIAASAKSGGGGNPPAGGGTTPVDTTVTQTTPVDTNSSGGGGTGTTPKPPGGGTTPVETTPSTPQQHSDPVFTKAIKKLGPSDANSIPLPLIILGVLALLLLAAGAAGLVARKLQERRDLATPNGTPPPQLPPRQD